jgi:hypothetical protein
MSKSVQESPRNVCDNGMICLNQYNSPHVMYVTMDVICLNQYNSPHVMYVTMAYVFVQTVLYNSPLCQRTGFLVLVLPSV